MPSVLVQTVSAGEVAEGSPAMATRPAGEAATSTCGAEMSVTCRQAMPSVVVQRNPFASPPVVPYAT